MLQQPRRQTTRAGADQFAESRCCSPSARATSPPARSPFRSRTRAPIPASTCTLPACRVAEAEIVAHQHGARAQRAPPADLLHEFLRAKAAPVRGVNGRISTCSMPSSRISAARRSGVVISARRALRRHHARGMRIERQHRGFQPRSSAIRLTRRRIRRWPKCTPSKLPMVSALGPKSRRRLRPGCDRSSLRTPLDFQPVVGQPDVSAAACSRRARAPGRGRCA